MNTRAVAVRFCVFLVATLMMPPAASAAAVLSVSPTTLNVSATAGAAIPSQSVSISNAGNGALKWSVSTPSASWLAVSPKNGVNSGSLTVSFPSPLAAGPYSASFVVSANGQTATVTVNLSIAAAVPPVLTGVSVLGATSVNVGQTSQYTARATYSDGSTQDLTSGPTWSTSNTGVATITQTGLLSAIAGGGVMVQAVFGGFTGQLAITVASGGGTTLTGLFVLGPTSVNVGQTAQYTARATYSDGSSQTLSGPTVWWYTYESTATIDHATGILTGVASGAANVRFDYNQAGVWTSSTPYPISVIGTAPTITGLSITGSTSVTVGQTAQYTATATYSDGSSQNMTTGPSWSTSNTSLATITQTGVMSALASGTVNVQASYSGVTATPLPVSLVAPPAGNVIYVSTSGSDSNSGSQTSPVRTIQRGVALANQLNTTADVTVSIGAGVYRESVQVFSLNTTKSLTLQGAGSSTILTGSDDWSTGWTLQGDGSYAHAWSYRWGTKPIPNGWTDYWNWDGNGYKRNRLLRWEQVVVNGSPLQLVLTRAEVAGAGTFYVDENGSTIYMRLPTGASYAGAQIEVATRKISLAINGRNNVTLRTFAVMRNLGAIQESMVQIANLQNLMFDRLEIRFGNYAGMSTAYVNGLQIYNSIFSDNGVNGFDAIGDITALMQDSEVARNNWHGWPNEHKGFDTVHKWTESRDVTIRRGNFVDNWGSGIWFDGDNQRILIDNVFSARNFVRGAYMELNKGPITIQNSKFCENSYEGIANARTNNLTVTGNQIFNNKFWQVTGTGSPTPLTIVDWQTGQGYLVTGQNWTLTNNIIKGQLLAGGDPPTNECYPGPCGWAFWAPNDDIFSYIRSTMTTDYNTWYHSGATRTFNISTTYGGAIDWNAFRTVMQAVKPSNETHSTWGNPGTLSCTPQ